MSGRMLIGVCFIAVVGVLPTLDAFRVYGGVTQEVQFESLPTLKPSQVLPSNLLTGPNHVVEQVVNDGYLNIYTIQSRFGRLRAVSDAQLRQYVHELNAVARMEAVEKSDEFQRGVLTKAGDVVYGARDLVVHPVDTVSGSVSGVGAVFGRAGEAVTGRTKSDAEDSRLKNAIGFSKTKRDYAFEFDVDVYSRNPILQEHLDSLAWAGYAGNLSMSALLMAVPGGAGVAVSVTAGNRLMNKVYRDLPPNELRLRSRAKLQGMGVNSEIVDLYIENEGYTPREQHEIVEALAAMPTTENRSQFVKFAVLSEDADMAFFRQRQAAMNLDYHRRVAPLARFVAIGRTTVAVSREGILVFNAPLDYLVWTPKAAAFMRGVTEATAGITQVNSRQVRLTGTASPLARKGLEELGWKVLEGVEGGI